MWSLVLGPPGSAAPTLQSLPLSSHHLSCASVSSYGIFFLCLSLFFLRTPDQFGLRADPTLMWLYFNLLYLQWSYFQINSYSNIPRLNLLTFLDGITQLVMSKKLVQVMFSNWSFSNTQLYHACVHVSQLF